jgi:hypothetical protein
MGAPWLPEGACDFGYVCGAKIALLAASCLGVIAIAGICGLVYLRWWRARRR